MQNIMWDRKLGTQKRSISNIEDAYLYELIPASADDNGVLGVGAESHAGDPVGVSLVGDGELAVSKSIPQLDGTIARSGDNLTVVSREGYGEDIIGVANEGTGGNTGGELPETEGLVPGTGKSIGTIGRDHLFDKIVSTIILMR
jgi:hypothetical protein